MRADDSRTWACRALTGVWTGDAQGKPERLITTGLLGSIRWWLEVLVRGLGGSACDPTQTKCQGRRHCVACELFGCTGWARKFRFDVLDANDEVQATQIKKDETFKLRFMPLRSIREEEWALLDLTFRLIAEYGAIGGKTVLKPSDEASRMSELHHQDFGLLEIRKPPEIETATARSVRAHLQNDMWWTVPANEFAWASIQHFWFVGGRHLARQSTSASTYNKVLGRDERKACVDCGQVHHPRQKCPKTKNHPKRHSDRSDSDASGRWLAGGRGESKKVFSFKNPPRTFGFVKPGVIDMAGMRQRLKAAWPSLTDTDVIDGPAVLTRLLSGGTGGTP